MIGLGKAEKKKRDPSVLESLEELDWHQVEESYKVNRFSQWRKGGC